MNGYFFNQRTLRPEAVNAFKRASTFVDQLPETINGEWVRCHEVARAVLRHVLRDEGWEVQDGVYGHVEHSWLVHRGYRALLDTYAVGAFPPVKLVDPYGPEGRLYERRRSRNDIVRRHVTVMGWFKNTTSSGTSMFL